MTASGRAPGFLRRAPTMGAAAKASLAAWRGAVGLLVLAALAVAGRPARAARGRVTYATEHWAFFDRGTADGLLAGHTVAVVRRGHRVARCRISHDSEHHAACSARGIQPGDVVLYRARRQAKKRVTPGSPPMPVSIAVAQRFAHLRIARVPFRGAFGSGNLVGLHLKAAIEHESWVGLAALATRYHRESVEVSLAGVPLWGGFSVSADATVYDWPDRPTNTRYRPQTPVQLFVWQTAVTRRMAGGLTLSAGRFQPWDAPGVSLLDGVQVGYAPASGTSEFGAYAGALPDIETLGVTGTQWTTGLYVAQRFGLGGPVSFRYEARAGFTNYKADPGRVETEATASANFGSALTTDVDVRLALAGVKAPAPAVDAFRGSFDLRPTRGFTIRGSYRYLSAFAADADALFTFAVPGSRHLDGAVTWDLSPDVIIGADSDATWILDTAGTKRADVGPELMLPHFFGARGSLAAGVREGFGWTGGPVAWVQGIYSPSRGFHLLLRGDYMSTTYYGQPGDRYGEAGLYGSVDFDITHQISARIALMGRMGSGTGAIDGSAGLTGRF